MRRLPVAFLVFAAVLVLAIPATPFLGIVDDAWITYTYARNLAAGHGIVFNPGERVEGCTAFLHMVLLAPFAWLTDRLDIVAVVINVLAWAGVVTLLWSFIRRRDGGPVGVLGWLVTAFAAAGLSGLAWTYSGMEMPLVALAWLGAVRLHLWEREGDRWPILSALVTVAAGLLRPDGILVAVTLTLSTWYAGPGRLRWRRAATFAAIVLTLFGGYWLWRWHYFGYLLPNTFYAKVTSVSGGLTVTGIFYLLRWTFGMGLPLLAAIFMVMARKIDRPVPRWVRVMQGLVATSVGYVLLVGADFFSYHRYLLPSYAPLLLLVWWYGVTVIAARRREPGHVPMSKPGRVVVAVLVFFVLQSVYFVGRIPPQGLVHGFIVENTKDWSQVAKLVERTTPPDAGVATIPIGAMGYFTHRYILDLVGLTDTHIAHANVPTGVAITGHEKYDIPYVLERAPELILTWPGLMPAPPEGLAKWVFSNIGAEAQKHLMADAEARRRYTFVWLKPPEEMPIRRGSIERWKGLNQGVWSGEQKAFGVIALLRNDLVGNPVYAAYQPMDPNQSAWLWYIMAATTRADLARRLAALDKGYSALPPN